jgi:hypothetical protein
VKLDDERLGKYLDEIAAETIDIEKTINIGRWTTSFLQITSEMA